MEGWLLSFIMASVSSLLWTSLPSPILTIICLISSLTLLLRFPKHSLLIWVSGFFAGLVWISSVGHWYQYWQLQVDDFNQTVLIEGVIDSLSAIREPLVDSSKDSHRFNVQVHSVDGESQYSSPYSFRLSWYKPEWELMQGQKVRLLVKIKPAHGLANEGGFHYQQWLFSQRIQATGYVKKSELNERLVRTSSVRQKLLNTILSFELSEERWLAALALGYRGLLDTNDWRTLQATGTSHLVAISGLHMAVVAGLSYSLLVSLLSLLIRHQLLSVGISAHKFASAGSLGISLFYAYLAGFSIPTARAWVMMLVVIGLMLLHQSWSKTQSLILLAVIVIVFFPLSVYGISLWLSFLAVIIILYSLWRFPTRNDNGHIVKKWLGVARMQLLLSLFMLPLVMWQFSILSVSAPFINLIAVPVVTFILVPICVVSSFVAIVAPSIAEYGFMLANSLTHYCVNWLIDLGDAPLSFNPTVMPSKGVLSCLFMLLVWAFLPKLPLPKHLIFIWLLPLLSLFNKSQSEDWRVDVLDVGQGLSVLLTRNRHAILYDTGPAFPSGFNTVEAAVLPLLRRRGIEKLDLLIISHNDNDHAGGIKTLLSSIDVRQVISSEDNCVNGWRHKWLGIELQALWPLSAMLADENDASCVIKVSDGQHSVLLTGDIDKRVEQKLITHHGDSLGSSVLIAPHHGSNSSSTRSFIQWISPDYVVFSQGFMNRWRFPRAEVVKRYKDYGVRMFSTSDSGQISFIFKNGVMKIERFRQDIYPYWYANHVRPIGIKPKTN